MPFFGTFTQHGAGPVYNAVRLISTKSHIQAGGRFAFSPKINRMLISRVKSAETSATIISDDGYPQSSPKKSALNFTPIPSEFEELIQEVCDGTEIAEVKLKLGSFEMHMKRKIGASKLQSAAVSPTSSPPIITTAPEAKAIPATSSVSHSPESSSKPISVKANPFTNIAMTKSLKLAAIGADGSSAHTMVSSPTVGLFRRCRTIRGKKQPPSCKEGDVIEEGQVIGFLDQFGTELPVKSDVAGEVVKLLFKDEEAVGYGDPLIAVLPSFHGINVM